MKNRSNKPKVFVGVSGGVDSSVALALLKQQGYDVTGVFLKVWSPDFLPCEWKEERRSAMRVCAVLGVPFLTFDCEKEYKKEVVDYMIREYKNGRVPNPDVFCNKYVKFGVFLEKSLKMGADYIATGHYAKITDNKLLESVDKNKDQSYFLYTLNKKQLSHALFPVGGITKPEVRKIACKFGLPTAQKKDSQGVCFLGKLDMKEFLVRYIKTKKGKVLNTKGETIGFHDGAAFLTIGQRHGFTVVKKSVNDSPLFVISKNLKKNIIIVADKIKEKDIVYSIKNIHISHVHFIGGKTPKLPLETSVRIRYRQEKQKCVLHKESGAYIATLNKPQNAVAVGQSAVFYDGEVCLGGGIIEKTI